MNLNKDRSVGMSAFTITLGGDGTLSPRLAFQSCTGRESFAYVNASDLRIAAKTLNKWAKKLEEHEAPEADGN